MSIFKYIDNFGPFGIDKPKRQIEGIFGIGGGNKQTLNANLKSRRSMTQDTNISDELIMSTTNNLVNTLVNDIIVANDVFIVNKTEALNKITIDNVQCGGDMNINNIEQVNKVTVEIMNEIKNKVTTTVKSNIATNIKETITKQQPSKDYIGAIMDKNNAALTEFNKAGAAELQKMKDTVKAAASSFSSGGFSIGGGNSQTANVNMDLQTDIATTLGISTSVTSTSMNNITNSDAFSTKVNNFISMINKISTENIIEISNLKCGGSFNLTDIEQFNDIKASFQSSFNNEVTTSISRTITTNISKAYTSFYDAIDIVGQDQPEAQTMAQYDMAEAMRLLTLYHLCTTDTPEALELKCAIEKRLIEIGGPNAPPASELCAGLLPELPDLPSPPVKVLPVVPPPVVPPPVVPPPRVPPPVVTQPKGSPPVVPLPVVAPPPVVPPPVVAPPPPVTPPETFSLFKPPYLYFLIGGVLFLILIIILLLSSKKSPESRESNRRDYDRYDD